MEWLFIILLVAFIGAAMRQGKSAKPVAAGVDDRWRQVPEVKTSSTLLHHWPQNGDRQRVVGCDFRQAEIKKAMLLIDATPGTKRVKGMAALVLDNGNLHDKKAVRVEVRGLHVGYLPKEEARSFRRRLGAHKLSGQATNCAAELWGGYTSNAGNPVTYAVSLDIKPL
jgi:hypothetical protein